MDARSPSEPSGSLARALQPAIALFAGRAAPILLGAVSALGFAPFNLWPAMGMSLVVLLRLVGSATSLRHALATGWGFGFGLGIASLPWLAHAFSFQSAMPQWMGWAAVALLSAYTAIYWALPLGVAYAASKGLPPIIFAMQASAAFTAAEWLRGILLTGFPWNPLAAIWMPVPEVTHNVATIGALGLSGLTILFAGMIAAITRGDGLRPLITTAGIAILLGASRTPAGPDTGTPITLIQANVEQSQKWKPGEAAAQLAKYIALTGPRRAGSPRLIFWPETAITQRLDTDPALRRAAASILGSHDLLFTGAIGTVKAEDFTNSVFVLDAAGTILARYDKAHLVPFGEYLPFASALERLGISRLVPGNADFVPGPGPRTLAVDRLKIGVSICYEIIFPAAVLDESHRPAFLFNPSNDAWFGWGGPQQHLAQARLRAIEEGLPIIRATPTGQTAVIRSDGSIAASIPAHQAGRLDTFLPSAAPPPPFALWRNFVPLGAALIMFLTSLLWHRRP